MMVQTMGTGPRGTDGGESGQFRMRSLPCDTTIYCSCRMLCVSEQTSRSEFYSWIKLSREKGAHQVERSWHGLRIKFCDLEQLNISLPSISSQLNLCFIQDISIMPPVSLTFSTPTYEILWLTSNISLAWLNDASAHGQLSFLYLLNILTSKNLLSSLIPLKTNTSPPSQRYSSLTLLHVFSYIIPFHIQPS